MTLNSKFHDEIFEDLLYIIAKKIHTDDLFHLSNCTVSLNCIIHNPIFLRKIVYSIDDSNMKRYIKKKWWNLALCIAARNGELEICKYFVSLGAKNLLYNVLCGAARNGHLELCKYLSLIHI